MIRVNLIGERRVIKKRVALDQNQKMAIACTMILVIAGGAIGWRYLQLRRESAALDVQLSSAQKETTRLHSIIAQVQQFEQRKAQLQQRVSLIEQLRKDQTGPVHMLDEISRVLPPLLWLTELKQSKDSTEVLIDGKSGTLTGLSDFVAGLESTGYFKRSIEIVSTQAETSKDAGDTVKFQIKAVFQTPADAAHAAPAAVPPATPSAGKTGA